MELDGSNPEGCKSLINSIYGMLSDGIHFSAPISSFRTDELDLVRGVLQILQGFCSSLFYWDHTGKRFCAKRGIYVSHLSQSSLLAILKQFTYAATCLQLVQIVVHEVETSAKSLPPTLKGFASSVSSWLKRLRDTTLKEEKKISKLDGKTTPTLLGLSSSLSSLCSGAEYLLQVVNEAIPKAYLVSNSSIPAAELAVHVLDTLYKKLDEVCLVQGGQEEAYQMLLQIFVGSLLPYIEGLDSWLFEGTLDDPFEEMFFYANQAISVDEAEFWEKSYLLRSTQYQKFSNSMKGKGRGLRNCLACPLFMKDIAKSVVSAGKSLQLIRHVPTVTSVAPGKENGCGFDGLDGPDGGAHHGKGVAGLTLSELFCISVAGLVGDGDHIFRYFCQDEHDRFETLPLFESNVSKQEFESGNADLLPAHKFKAKSWYKFLEETLLLKEVGSFTSASMDASRCPETEKEKLAVNIVNELPPVRSFCPENPVITVCQILLGKNKDSWKTLNLSRRFELPPLNDEALRNLVFAGESAPFSAEGTNFTFGFQFGESEYVRSHKEAKLLDKLFPFPTILPAFQDDIPISELLPWQKSSTLSSKILSWIQNVERGSMPLPLVIMQECLIVYVKEQVDHIGKHMLLKLMNDWRLMDELAVLRAIYLLGSGDLLQHFLTVIFSKLDKGETWDDDFELNTILQESISNSADGMVLSAPDSLVVSITKSHALDGDEQPNTARIPSTPQRNRARGFGMDGLDLLKFTYKVSWPLELIANTEAIKKYNQVMSFLLKVKRAKFALDKARRWMWKGRGTMTNNRKHHWLVEQKLLHFVDAFHQYVMDRVYHSAWRELCEGMVAARSLDEVIEVHEAYLLSIQRQCFVVPDKLWALIASRINSILGLALDFYSIQQTLSNGGAVSTIKARCEMEVDRIEKQFDDCMAFLLRVLSFKLNVGHFPHLADLVTRINYNYFYMSDSGTLMTAPSTETVSSRLGKAFVGRTN